MNLLFKNFLLNNSVFIYIVLGLLAVGIPVWTIQQRNVDILDGKIQEINLELKSARLNELERLKLKKDILVIEKDKTIILNGIGATLAQAFGAVVLGATAYVGYQNFKVGADNLKINEESLKVSKEQQATERFSNEESLRVSEEKQVTERFSKAIEHLGSDGEEKIHIRLGGIYALAQIAKDSPQNYHWTIVEILSAFIREKQSRDLLAKTDDELSSLDSHDPIFKVPVDIRTALTVLGDRNIKEDPEGKIIDLKRVILTKVDIQKSKFPKADFSGAYLQNANLNGANFSGAILRGANLLGSSIIDDADLTKSCLAGARLTGAFLHNSKFNEADFRYANLEISDLRGADLSGSNLIEANLSGANLSNANLSKTHLVGANLHSTNLSGTDLRGASLCGSITNTIKMPGLEFSNESYIEAKNLTREQIDSARIDENTELPDDLKPSIKS